MKLLDKFRKGCRNWYPNRSEHNYQTRQYVEVVLMTRHSQKTLLRHQHQIKEILDKVENEIATNLEKRFTSACDALERIEHIGAKSDSDDPIFREIFSIARDWRLKDAKRGN